MIHKVWKRMKCTAGMRGIAIGAALIFAALAGCDLTGQYDKKFHEALDAAAKRAVFDLVRPDFTDALDAAKAGVGVKLRLPIVFDNNSKSVKQPALNLPGGGPVATYGLTRDLDDTQGKWAPVAVSIAAAPKGEQKGEALQNMIAKGLSAAAPGAAWSDVAVLTPAGQTTTLKRLRLDMSKLGLAGKAGAKADGSMDVYLVDAGSEAVGSPGTELEFAL